MSWLKELSLVLIVGCLAVFAADSAKKGDEPRVINDQDVRLLINPFAFLQAKTTTPKPERPTTIVVRPPYHYPYYPSYPHYPNDDYYPHHPTHPTPPNHPTYHPTRPSKPPTPPTNHPTHPPVYPTHPPVYPTHPPVYPSHPPMYPQHPPVYPQHPPMYPQHPPVYPYYPPQMSQPPFGFYPPWFYPQQPGQPPYIVVIHPPIPKPSVPGLPDVPELPELPEIPEVPEVPEVPNVPGTGNGNGKTRYQVLRHPKYPYVQSARAIDDYQAAEEEAEDQQQENDNEDELGARNIKLEGVSITADSAEDSDTIAVDTKDIKLPFGIHLASHPVSGRKIKDQEALIYLRNFKKGRQLKEGETA